MASPGALLRAAKAMPGAAQYTPAPQGSGGRNLGNSLGRYSPLAAQLGNEHGYASAYPSSFLARPSRTFTEGALGPFSPILPTPVDQPPEGAERPEPRRWEYEPGWNLPSQPGSEGLKLASFSTLRTIADLYSVARACIQLRKAEIRGLDWDIIPSHEASKAYHGDRDAMKDFADRRAKLVKFFRHPDPDYFSFGTWLDAMLEEVFVYDALSILIRPKWGRGMGTGLLGSDLDSLQLLSGPTIRPLVDLHGSTPRPPAPAYQQFLQGVPRSDLMTMITHRDLVDAGMDDSALREFRGDQLLYLPMVPRRWTPYGLSPVERALIPIMSGLQKQAYQLAYYREGCYDHNTEILTDNGWKLFHKLDDEDKVATRAEDGEFEWQLPKKRQCFRYDGPMVEFKNKSLDLLVTPNHRMLVKRPDFYIKKHPNCEGREWHIREAQFFVENPSTFFEVPVTSSWKGTEPPKYFIIPALTGRQRKFEMPMLEFCRFLGLYLAEGWVQDRSLEGTGRREVIIWISQSPRSPHLDDISNILDTTGLKWKYDPKYRKFSTTCAQLGRWLKANTGHLAWNKYIPAQFKEFSCDYLNSLLDGMMIGDGTETPDNWGRRYTTTSEQLADDVQELFQKTGTESWIKEFQHKDYAILPEGRIGQKDRRLTYIVFERMMKTHGVPRPKIVDYHGYVYCVTVPNGIVYVRRNGKATWCGNTVPECYISPGDVNMTPNQIRELQDALNAFAGDPAWKHKIIVLPPGSKTEQMRTKEIADQFDEIVMSQVTMAFDVNPMEIGLLPRVSTVASPFAAREMAQASRTIHERTSTKPLLKFLADLFDNIMHRVVGQDDMKFTFEGLQEEDEANQLTQMLAQQVQFGIRSVDEARDELELEPWGLPESSGPVFFGPSGPIPFGQVQVTEGGIPPPAAATEGATEGGPSANETFNRVPPSGNAIPDQGAGAASDLGPELTPAHMAAQAFMDQPSAKPGGGSPSDNAKQSKTLMSRNMYDDLLQKQERARMSELETLARHLKNGRDPESWEPKNIPHYAPALMHVKILEGIPRSEAVEEIAQIIMGDQDYEWSYNLQAA